MRRLENEGGLPLGLVLLEDLALGVVAHVHDVDEAAQIELFGSELGHGDGIGDRWLVGDRDEVESCYMRQESLVWGCASGLHGFKDSGGGGQANGDDDKTLYLLQHLLPGLQTQ
jgi:hypothetical protein